MNYELWMERAKVSISELKQNQEFFVKGLFKETVWDELENKDKREFGKHFKNEINENKLSFVKWIEDVKGKGAKYIIT